MTRTEYERGAALGAPTVEVSCYRCGVRYSIPRALYEVRVADHQNVFCPLGHEWHYTAGKTRVQVQRERAEKAEREAARAIAKADQEQARAEAVTGQLRKARTRAMNGVCPCCNRSFPNVLAHIRSKHPTELVDVDVIPFYLHRLVVTMLDAGTATAKTLATLNDRGRGLTDGRVVAPALKSLRGMGLAELINGEWELTPAGRAAALAVTE